MGKLRKWIDAYAGVDEALRPLVAASNPLALHGMRRAAQADHLLAAGKALGIGEATVEEVAEPFLDQFATPWDKIHAALIERAAGGVPVLQLQDSLPTAPPPPSIEEMLALMEKATPPRKILLCAIGRAEAIKAELAKAIAKEGDLLVSAALARIEVRESDLCDGDEAILVPHPEDNTKGMLRATGPHRHQPRA